MGFGPGKPSIGGSRGPAKELEGGSLWREADDKPGEGGSEECEQVVPDAAGSEVSTTCEKGREGFWDRSPTGGEVANNNQETDGRECKDAFACKCW